MARDQKMSRPVHSVLIVTKSDDPEAWALGLEIAAWLESRTVAAQVVENRREDGLESLLSSPAPDMILVLAGDGTLLSVARRTLGQSIPLLGLNLGKLGFLAGTCPRNWKGALSKILQKGAMVSERIVLRYEVRREGEAIRSGMVVNDLVLNRGILARLVNLELWVGKERLGALRADGLIISTPTGTTGYTFSAGGPLLYPSLDVYAVTPICPFLNEIRPLVLPGDAVLRAVVLECDADIYVTLDGQDGFPLAHGDEVSVTPADVGLHFVSLDEESYFGKLKAKGFIRDDELEQEG